MPRTPSPRAARMFAAVATLLGSMLIQATPAAAQEGHGPAAPPGNAALPATNQRGEALKLSGNSHDWGTVPDHQPLEHVINFSNISGRKIRVSVRTSCGCTVANLSRPDFGPGEEGSVTVHFDPFGRVGSQFKSVTFTIDEPAGAYPQQTYTVSADVQSIVAFDPPRIMGGEIDRRDGKFESFTVTGRGPSFVITKAVSSSPFVEVKLGEPRVVMLGDEQRTKILVELLIGKGAPIGHLDASIVFETNEPQAAKMTYTIAAEILGDVRLNPAQSTVRCTGPGEPFSTVVRLDTRRDKPLKITGIDTEARKDINLAVDLVPMDGGKFFMITVSGVAPPGGGLFTAFALITVETAEGPEVVRIPVHIAAPAKAYVPPAEH